MTKEKYSLRGVSASKDEVHKAIKGLDKGLFPTAFCKILPDYVSNDPEYCNIMHADTAGTKTSLAYLCWKEFGDLSVWKGIAQDALVMNLDDMACVGCIDNVIVSSTIGRNKHLIPFEVIEQIIRFLPEFSEMLSNYGIEIISSGGETADVGDIVRSIDVGYSTFGRMKREDLVINNILDGNVIVGFASDGKAVYESTYNSGIGSNGLTSARHDLLDHYYAGKFPESFSPETPKSVVYTGKYRLGDRISVDGNDYNVGNFLLSTTRTYLPLIKQILENFKDHISGMIHCTGGGQTKVMKFVSNKHIIKNNLMVTAPVFKLIQETSQTDWKEMYKVFNMGHRLEIYTDETTAQKLIDMSHQMNIPAQIIGFVKEAPENLLTIESKHGTFTYH